MDNEGEINDLIEDDELERIEKSGKNKRNMRVSGL
jgi:hypothetical protein